VLDDRKRVDAGQRIYTTIVQQVGSRPARGTFEPLSSLHARDLIAQVGSSTIGELRKLSDAEWQRLEIPALCRILLKYCVRQAGRIAAKPAESKLQAGGSTTAAAGGSAASARPQPYPSEPFMDQLAMDFNYGQPFDLSLFKEKLQNLIAMGFSREDSMEVLCVTENKSFEAALEVSFAYSH
jgi:hypothetical protein